MNNLTNPTNLKEKLESYLNRSCQAEAEGNRPEAERQFRYALYCEDRSRSDVENAREYVRQAGHVYPDAQSQSEQGIIGGDNETQTTN